MCFYFRLQKVANETGFLFTEVFFRGFFLNEFILMKKWFETFNKYVTMANSIEIRCKWLRLGIIVLEHFDE